MAVEIDERIVELQFDNRDFERNASQSLGTIEKLKRALNFGGEDPLNVFQISMSKVTEQFSILEEIATGVFSNIGVRAEQVGEQLLKSVTVDQVSAGWGKFEEKTKAVQTIMSATGHDIDTVNGYLEKLMWFTDETSYNFVDMTSNIGKFTAQNVPLDRATNSMIGIANWAALAGQGANEASRAMYNLAQSLGAGYVKYQDWMSVINANMDIAQFKERVIEVAKELGTLNDAAETAEGNLVTVESFGENLTNDKWFTSDVLIKVLEEYGEYANLVYDITQETGEATSDVMASLEGMYEGVGEAAFKAGQEAKTFSDVLDATKDAVSSAWLTMFETVFGNYEQAKVMWTDLANGLYEVFAEPINARNEMLKGWAEMGGRDVFLEGVYAIASKLVGALNFLKETWAEVFPPTTSEELMSITESFTNFWTHIELTEPALEALHTILTSVFSILRSGKEVIVAAWTALEPLRESLNDLAGRALLTAAAFSEWLAGVVASAAESGKLTDIFRILTEAASSVIKMVLGVGDAFKYLASQVQYVGGGIFDAITNWFDNLAKKKADIPIGDKLSEILQSISKFASEGGLKGLVTGVIEAFAEALRSLGDVLGDTDSSIYNLLTTIAAFKFGSGFTNTTKGITAAIRGIGDSLKSFNPSSVVDSVNKLFNSLTAAVNQFKKGGGVTYYLKMAASITAISISLKLLSTIEPARLLEATIAIKALFKMLDTFLTRVDGMETNSKGLLTIGITLGLLASSMKSLASLDMNQMIAGLAGVGALIGELVAFLKLTQTVKMNPGIAAALVAIGAAIGLLVPPLIVFALIPFERLAQGVIALGVILGELAAFSKFADKTTELLATAGAITIMSVGITALSASVAVLSALSLGGVIQGCLALLVILGELTGMLAIVGKLDYKNLLGASAAIAAVALALTPLSLTFLAFSTMDLAAIGKGVLALGAALAEISIAIAALTKFGGGTGGLAAAGSIAILASSIIALVPAFAALGALSLPSIGKALLAIAGALTIFVAAATFATGVVPGILALGAAITGIVGSIALMVNGIATLVTGLGTLATAFIAFSSMTDEEAKQAGDNTVTFLTSVADGIVKSQAIFSAGFLTLFSTMVDAVIDTIPNVLDALADGIMQVIGLVVKYTPDLLEAIEQILIAIRDKAFSLGDLAAEIVVLFVDGLIYGLISEFPRFLSDVGKALDDLWDFIVESGKAFINDAVSVAKDIAGGFLNGLKSVFGLANKTGEELGGQVIDGMRTGVDAHSDSQLAIAVAGDVGGGLKTGLFKSIPSIKDTAKKVATDGIVKPLKDNLNQNGSGKTLTTEYLKSMIDGLKSNSDEVSSTAGNVAAKASDTAIETVKSKKIGETSSKQVAKEIDEDKEIEKAIKEKAEKVSEIFETEFKKIDLALSKIGYEFDIWKAVQGPEIDENTIKMGEIIQAQKELSEYAKQYQVAYDNYQYLVNNPDLVQSPTELAEKQGEYMKYLTQMYQKANEIAGMQKDISDQYAAGAELALDEVFELQKAHASLIPENFEYSDEAKQAYDNFLNAVDEEAKQHYYDIWKELSSSEIEQVTGFSPSSINAEDVKRDIWKEIGLDPNNPLEGFLNVQDTVANLVSQTSTAYLAGLEEAYPTLIGTYGDIIAQGTQDVLEQAVTQYPEFQKVGEGMMEATSYGITSSASSVARAGVEVNNTTVMELESKQSEWEDVGTGMMDGIRKGIAERRSAVIEEAVEVALAALAAAKNALGIASPSKKFMEIGTMSVMGFAQGLSNSKDQAREAAETVTNAATDPIFSFGQRVREMLEDDFDPTITPVLDISQVEQNIRRLDDMWQSTGYRVVGDISASELAREADALASLKKEPTNVVYNETFTQNNYSPKALSAIDIYRQTNNQLMRGRVTR